MSSDLAPIGTASIPVRARTSFPVGNDSTDSVLAACAFLCAATVTGGTVLVRDWPATAGLDVSIFLGALDSMGGYVVDAPDGLTVTTRSTVGRYDGLTASLEGAGVLTSLILTLACFADSASDVSGVSDCTSVIEALRRIGADIEVDSGRIIIEPAALVGGGWSAVDLPGTLCGLILQLRVPDLEVDTKGLGEQQSRFLAEWSRVLHADEFLLPGSATLPHDYI